MVHGQSLQPVEVPIQIVRGDIIVKLEIEGRSYDFVIDTGASNSLILESARTRALEGLEAGGVIELLMPLTNRTVDADLIEEIDVRIMGQRLKLTNVAKLPWDQTGLFNRETNIFYDGILGSDLFDAFIVEFDYGHNRIRLHDKTKPLDDQEGVIVIPLRIEQGLAIAQIDVRLNDRLWHRDILVDTGFPGSLNLYGLQNADISALTARYGPHQGTGRKVEFMLGPCILTDIRTVAFREAFGDFESVHGVMGTDFLQNFRFAIDYERAKLYLFGLDNASCQVTLKE